MKKKGYVLLEVEYEHATSPANWNWPAIIRLGLTGCKNTTKMKAVRYYHDKGNADVALDRWESGDRDE